MQIAFFSNFLNHHQAPFSDELYKLTNGNYVFVETIPMPDSLKQGGYSEFNEKPYLLKAYESKQNSDKALKIALECDVMIWGSAPIIFQIERLKLNKLTFTYGERSLKRGLLNLLSPRLIIYQYYYYTFFYNKNIYYLGASAYTYRDLLLMRSFKDRCFKWGYFTKVANLDIEQIIKRKPTNKIHILWCARFLDWKRPEVPILLAQKLKAKGYDFQISMIGIGDKLASAKNLASKLDVDDTISFCGGIPNNEVLTMMQKNNIFIFTSNKREGWGAVLNEAMSNGCAVVASNQIGSVPYLIDDGINGYIYDSRNIDSLVFKVEDLIKNKEKCESFSRNAYNTIKDIWSPKNAAINLLQLIDDLSNNRKTSIIEGPCSKAEIIDL